MRWSSWGVVLSLAAHAGIAAGIVAIPKGAAHKSVLVSVVDKKKKDEKKKQDDAPARADEPPAPSKPIQAPRPAPKARPAPENTPPPPPADTPPPSAAAHPALAALPDLGISMAGGPGGPGIAVPAGPAARDAAGPRTTEGARPAATRPKDDDCSEEAVKPKPQGAVQAAYTESARTAGVEGKIRLELQIDAAGTVSSARVVSGLGYGLDEAAVAAARRMKFAPGTRCGKPVAARFVISMRFVLGE